jgi:hypothetical protein
MNVHWRNLTNKRKGKPENKFFATSGTIFRASTVTVSKNPAETIV